MGFRFRKSVKMGPFRINFSKRGIGWSVGGKGYRYTKKANGGTRTTISAPGTGLSYVHDSSSKSKSSTRKSTSAPKTSKVSQHNNVSSTQIHTKSSNTPNQSKPVYSYATVNAGSENYDFKIPQWPVKNDSIFDKFAKWIDKTFFGSDYNLTPEKLMIVALCTNILGLYRVYAGRKISAVISWIFLLFSFATRDWMLLFTLPWFVIDLIRIYLGNYGRLKSNQKFNFDGFKKLILNKKSVRVKEISSGISVIIIVLICALCPPTENIKASQNMTGHAISSVVSQSDNISAMKPVNIKTATETSTSTATSTESITKAKKASTTINKKSTTTTKKKTTTVKKTTTAKKTTTVKKATTTKKKTTTVNNIPNNPNGSVWVTANGKKYHSNPNCSRMKNPSKITLKDAKARGYTACSKCF